ncbi:beta-glucosidase, putative [Medicago truncatula]|uniref:Beta-glucosidase, putative n=1 Tax=Medicago truncatula TaxID=3880 RepID=G7KYN2_MEDTR|nr:beta-glucosidase, putative [Medicago truncatula]
MDSIILGECPPVIRKILGNILPGFSSNDKEKLKNGLDFVVINHYVNIKGCVNWGQGSPEQRVYTNKM